MKKLAKLLVLVVIALTLVGCQKKNSDKNDKKIDIENIFTFANNEYQVEKIIWSDSKYLCTCNNKDLYEVTFMSDKCFFTNDGEQHYYYFYKVLVEFDENDVCVNHSIVQICELIDWKE